MTRLVLKDRRVLDKIRKELLALKSESRAAWPRVGQFIDAVEESGYWQTEGAPSFTVWVRSFAHSLGRPERMLWRYLTAVRFYEDELWPLLKHRRIAAPPLAQLPGRVSPENLELLAKVARVAPKEAVEALGRRVVTGEIPREELSRAWETFRPALDGRTARGRGVAAPRIDRGNPDQTQKQRQVTIYHALQLGGEWTGYRDLDLYKVFFGVCPRDLATLVGGYQFDAVAVVRREGRQPEIHGIWAKGFSHHDVLGPTFAVLVDYCDYFWCVQPEEAVDGEKLDAIQPGIGLLRVRGVSVEVVRPAACGTPEISPEVPAEGLREILRKARCKENLVGTLLALAILG